MKKIYSLFLMIMVIMMVGMLMLVTFFNSIYQNRNMITQNAAFFDLVEFIYHIGYIYRI